MKNIFKDVMLVSSSMLTGMFLGIMIAPSSGEETRKNIGEYMGKLVKSGKSDCCDDEKGE